MTKFIRIKTTGKSMIPLIVEDNILVVVKKPLAKIALGDIVVFYQKNKLIGHRVVFKIKKQLLTKGDNILAMDKKINPRHILGVVVRIIKKEGAIDLGCGWTKLVNYYLLLYSLGSLVAVRFANKVVKLFFCCRHFLIRKITR